MILTVTPHPALDVTYQVDALRPGTEHRVRTVRAVPGGKGVNVARVLTTLGVPCRATGLLGGATGAQVRDGLDREGVSAAFVETGAETRRTVVVTGGGTSTSLWEPGSAAEPQDGDRLVAEVEHVLPGCAALVVSGSLPPGLPADLSARLADAGVRARVPVLVDADGPVLAAAARLPGIVLKPNAHELGRLVGASVDGARAALQVLAALRRQVRADWVVTLGADGLVAATSAGCWTARLDVPVAGNPTGAGDAVAAALAAALAAAGPAGVDWPRALADAVALGAAAVLRPVAGEVDLAAYARWRTAARVRAAPVPPHDEES